ncbi:MAG: cytochrome c biogenesis protein CcsA [Verrucomicrobia bacterium]|nr:cytochrome c biogenesis protein CcsA [Verrucomicrobiota bacterium]
MSDSRTIFQKIFRRLTSLRLTVICLGFLMALTLWGTLYQVDNGLFAAQQRFYRSWFFLAGGFLPFPGTRLVLTVLFVNLLCAMGFLLKMKVLRWGILLIHLGLVLLLVGGFVTFYHGQESYLSLREGEGSNLSSDYREWEVAIWKGGNERRIVTAIDDALIEEGASISLDGPGITLTVQEYHPNATPLGPMQVQSAQRPLNGTGIAGLQKATRNRDPEKDVPGGVFIVSAPGGEKALILLFGNDSRPVVFNAGDEDYTFVLRRKRQSLPTVVKLIDFKREMHSGTGMAKSYSSLVTILPGGVERQVLISMNKPLRYRGYTFYQASFSETGTGQEISTLAVVKNYGRLVPYIATTVTVVGLALHFLGMLIMKAHRKKLAVALLLFCGLAGTASADVHSVDSFARLPVLEGGRVMPMDSYARLKLLQFSGKSTFDRKPAVEWLARAVFTPDQTRESKVFLVDNPDVLQAIGIPTEERGRHSYNDLAPAAAKLFELAQAASGMEKEARTVVDNEILRLQNNLMDYSALLGSFRFAQPRDEFRVNNDELREKLGFAADKEEWMFADMLTVASALARVIEDMDLVDQQAWTPAQSEAFTLSSLLYTWSQHYSNLPIRMIPLRGHGDDVWLCPWDIIGLGFQDQADRAAIGDLVEMASAYRHGDQAAFDAAAESFEDEVSARLGESTRAKHIESEIFFNKAKLFYRAEWAYGLAFILALWSITSQRKWLYRMTAALIVLGLIPHTAGILLRMQIMGRPPVTNLYATFIFVAWICAMLGLILEYFQRNKVGLFVAGLSGLALLLVSGRFGTEGDTMGVVVAVLDSNFWLATHVVCITIGYAGCFVAGVIGHIYLLQAFHKKEDDPVLLQTYESMYGALAFGLTFAFLGTMLGGVWADQSWGRFWGWDPKENGALLIVLWSAILFHARMGGMIGYVETAAGCVLGVIWVLLAWLGVNLLGVGLHSYGFTSGLAGALYLSITVEILFVLITVGLLRRR